MHVAAKDLAEENDLICLVVNWIPPMNDEWPKFLVNPEHQGARGERMRPPDTSGRCT